MQFIVKNTKKDTIYNLMRDLNYHFIKQDEKTGELNFMHPIRGNAFPRFHIFLKINGQDLIFNLHLDQRAPIYKGAIAHEGEYSGKLIKEEAERIKQFLLIK
ncbi:MAG: hypothetical protein ABIG40_00020 [Parcubacteria group bacterium]